MIKWITENIATSSFDEAASTVDENVLIDVRDLVDKSGNTEELIEIKINQALEKLQQGKKVVVCCDYGLSRSNAIAVGILSQYQQISFEAALDLVLGKVQAAHIKLPVLSEVRKAVRKGSTPASADEKVSVSTIITGGHGFIGSILRKKIGDEVSLIAPTHGKLDLLRDSIALDDLIQKTGARTILHLAMPKICTGNDAMGSSLVMLKNVLDACVVNRCRLIFMSGWEVFSGYHGQDNKIQEEMPPCPAGAYGQTKMLSESLLQHFHIKYKLPISIIRSSPVYAKESEGPKFLWNFYNKAKQNSDIVTHKYLNDFPRLDLLHVDDLVSLIIKVWKSDFVGTVNVGSGRLVSTSDVAKLIVDQIGSKSKIFHREINDYVGNILLDTSKAKDVFGWKALVMPEDGLRSLIKEVEIANTHLYN